MNFRQSRVSFLLAALLAWMSCASASAVTYEFTFDAVDDGTVMAPFFGTGSVSFDGAPLPDGTFLMSDFSNIQMNFDFDSIASFTEQDIATPTDEVLFVISDSGQRLQFSSVGLGGTGPFAGAIDFVSGDMAFGLSTEPPGFGGNLDLYFVADNVNGAMLLFGNYSGTLVPEPSSLSLALAAPLLLFARRKRRFTRRIS